MGETIVIILIGAVHFDIVSLPDNETCLVRMRRTDRTKEEIFYPDSFLDAIDDCISAARSLNIVEKERIFLVKERKWII